MEACLAQWSMGTCLHMSRMRLMEVKTNGSIIMLHDTKHDLSQDSQDLLNAADYIDKNGWCQEVTRLGKSVCLWGSILAVTDGLGKLYDSAPRANALYS